MEKQQIKEQLFPILSKVFFNIQMCSDRINMIDLIDDLGMDSVTFITLIIEIESHFQITVADEYLLFDHFRNINGIVDIIYTHLNSNT